MNRSKPIQKETISICFSSFKIFHHLKSFIEVNCACSIVCRICIQNFIWFSYSEMVFVEQYQFMFVTLWFNVLIWPFVRETGVLVWFIFIDLNITIVWHRGIEYRKEFTFDLKMFVNCVQWRKKERTEQNEQFNENWEHNELEVSKLGNELLNLGPRIWMMRSECFSIDSILFYKEAVNGEILYVRPITTLMLFPSEWFHWITIFSVFFYSLFLDFLPIVLHSFPFTWYTIFDFYFLFTCFRIQIVPIQCKRTKMNLWDPFWLCFCPYTNFRFFVYLICGFLFDDISVYSVQSIVHIFHSNIQI